MKIPATAIHQRFSAGMVGSSTGGSEGLFQAASPSSVAGNLALLGQFGNPCLRTPVLPGATLAERLPVQFAGLVDLARREIGGAPADGHGLDNDLGVEAQVEGREDRVFYGVSG